MTRPNDPAFPLPGHYPDLRDLHGEAFREAYAERREPQPGMTLRTYIATHLLASYIEAYATTYMKFPNPDITVDETVKFADALIKRLGEYE